MPDFNYYVSAQNGNDTNNGLTPATAWATLTKAAGSAVAQAGGNTYVRIGPGIYRESFIPQNGISATEKLIYAGDPHCVHLVGDKPGRIRITKCNAQEFPQVGRVLDWTGKTNVELWDVEVDGSRNDYALTNVAISRRVKAISKDGINSGTNYNCTVAGCSTGISSGTNYNCTVVGGNVGIINGTNYNCTVVGCSTGISGCTNYNCTVVGGSAGISGGTNYNCTVVGGSTGISGCTNYNCTVVGGSTGISGGTSRGCRAIYCSNLGTTEGKHLSLSLDKILPNFLDIYEMLKGSLGVHVINTTVSTTINLQAEVLSAFTPSGAGKCQGAQLYVITAAASGNVLIELQKNVAGSWQTQRSKTVPCDQLINTEWNLFEFNQGSGDDMLTTAANTWRFRITADTNGQSTTIGGSNSTTPGMLSHFHPSTVPNEDILGQRRDYGMPSAYAADVPIVELDDVIFHTLSPSIRFTGHGEKVLKLPVRANQETTVRYQVRHNGALAGKEPQVRIQSKHDGPPIIGGVSATHSTGADTWEQLSVTVTAPVDCVLDVVLASRDPGKNAWFSAPSVT